MTLLQSTLLRNIEDVIYLMSTNGWTYIEIRPIRGKLELKRALGVWDERIHRQNAMLGQITIEENT